MIGNAEQERREAGSWYLVTPDPLDVGAIEASLRDPLAGGVCVFVGTTRQVTGAQITEELRYEAFPEMALAQMEELARLARERWPVLRCALHHRTGTVGIEEASVAVGVSTPHRAEAFDACRFLIDRLKEVVPVWKKEVFADGRTEWVQPGK